MAYNFCPCKFQMLECFLHHLLQPSPMFGNLNKFSSWESSSNLGQDGADYVLSTIEI